ncbi:M20/M25/M40 family metallo-hydrolase [bacterium]|nr:M20/M25/M40 family metallo-hydrolase [bacterium]
MNFLELCQQFIAIDSSRETGNLELVNFAAKLCEDIGLQYEVQTHTSGGVENANLVAFNKELDGPVEVLLSSRIDTENPGLYPLWTKTDNNPFNASIYNDELYGVGSSTKLDFLCKLFAIKEFGLENMSKPFILLGTFGEEFKMTGAIKFLRKNKLSIKRALVGSPTRLSVAYAGIGIATVEVNLPISKEEVALRKAHDLGESTSSQYKIFYNRSENKNNYKITDNPFYELCEFYKKMPSGVLLLDLDGGKSVNSPPESASIELDIQGTLSDPVMSKFVALIESLVLLEKEFEKYSEEGFLNKNSSLNLGMIRTNEDHIALKGCGRFLPTVNEDIYEGWIDTLKSTCSKLGASFKITDFRKPFSLDSGSNFIKSLDEISSGELSKLSYSTEANLFSRFGIETVAFGAGEEGAQTNEANEKVLIGDLKKSKEFYKQVLSRFVQ